MLSQGKPVRHTGKLSLDPARFGDYGVASFGRNEPCPRAPEQSRAKAVFQGCQPTARRRLVQLNVFGRAGQRTGS